MATAGEACRAGRELRPVREWGLDPMCFTHVHLLGFDLLALRPVPHMQGLTFRSDSHLLLEPTFRAVAMA